MRRTIPGRTIVAATCVLVSAACASTADANGDTPTADEPAPVASTTAPDEAVVSQENITSTAASSVPHYVASLYPLMTEQDVAAFPTEGGQPSEEELVREYVENLVG